MTPPLTEDTTAATRPRAPRELKLSVGVGDRLASRYYLLEELGRGAMGVVFRAADLREGGFVALKLAPHRDELAITRFRRGTGIMLGLDHPNLCRAKACGRTTDCSYAVLDLVEGPSLFEAAEPGQRLPWKRATRLVAGLCQGLAALHARGSVHRDVKPSNLILQNAGARESLVLIDFDLAKPYGPELRDSGRFSRAALRGEGLTGGQGLSGTPVYMTAERLRGASATPDSDVFAAALVLHGLLLGALPTSREDYESLVSLISARARPLEGLAELPDSLARILERALAPRRDDRYPSAQALADDLIALEPLSERPTRTLRALPFRALSA